MLRSVCAPTFLCLSTYETQTGIYATKLLAILEGEGFLVVKSPRPLGAPIEFWYS